MNKILAIVGMSGVGKTSLAQALAKTGRFATAYEQHAERPFQSLFKNDPRFALANQLDYFLLRAEQEKELRQGPAKTGLVDGGLDLDFHGFTRLFHSRNLLSDPEYDLCQRLYAFIRASLPRPELIVRLNADVETVASRLSARERINIASAEDTTLFNTFLDEWLATLPSDHWLVLDVTDDDITYSKSIPTILGKLI